MSERFPRKRITKENVEANPRAGLRIERPKRVSLYRRMLEDFAEAENELIAAGFDAAPEAERRVTDVAGLKDQILKLRGAKKREEFKPVIIGITRMRLEAERLRKHDRATIEVTKAVEGIEEKAQEKRKRLRLEDKNVPGSYLGAPRYAVPSTEVQGVRYMGEPKYPVPAVYGAKAETVAKVEQAKKEEKKEDPPLEPKPEVLLSPQPEVAPEPPPAPPVAAEAAPPAVEKKEAQPKSAPPQEEFFVGDGPNDTWAPEKPSEQVTPEDSFEFIGDGPNDAQAPEKAKEARSELKRIIEEFYGGEHSLEPDVREESPPPTEPKEETHKGGVYAAVWTGRPEDVNPNPKEGRPAAEIVPPGVETTIGIPKEPNLGPYEPEWAKRVKEKAVQKRKEEKERGEEQDEKGLWNALKRAFK